MAKQKNETVTKQEDEIQIFSPYAKIDPPEVATEPAGELLQMKVPPPPNPQKASLGRIVIFKLSEQNAAEINRRRTTGYSIAERIKLNSNSNTIWPIGAQAHIGNEVNAGDEFPMTVVRVWSDTCVNGQVLLDGNDTYWASSVSHGEHNGMWQWPPRV